MVGAIVLGPGANGGMIAISWLAVATPFATQQFIYLMNFLNFIEFS